MTASGQDLGAASLEPSSARPPWTEIAPADAWRRLGGAASFSVLVAATLGAIAVATAAIGARPAAGFFVLVGLGAVLAHGFPARRIAIAIAVGMLAMALLNPVFSAYFLVLVSVLATCRRRALPFAAALLLGALVLPKLAFSRFYHQPGFWNWLNEPSLALAIFSSALWWRARSGPEGPAPADRADDPGDDLASFALLYLFPSHAAYPMAFSPRLLARADRVDAAQVAGLLGWFVAKSAALLVLRRLAPHGFLRSLGAGDASRLGVPTLWGVVLASYLETYLTLASSADIPVLIGRLYGWALPNPFRAALLAWNPVELWRRWGIYNRYLLLRLVYFPLGGHRRHRYQNVMLTFLASAWFLHSGWFGSKYWSVGAGGWRDEALYFGLQGIAVCSCLALWQLTGKDPRADRGFRVSLARAGGMLATQGWSALAHVFVLAQGIDLGARARIVARCLGLS